MRTPIRSAPEAALRWTSRARWLRWFDAAVAWLALWALLGVLMEDATAAGAAALALLVAALAASLGPLRRRWRPASAAVGVALARRLRPGDRAWYVRADRVESVLVTARRGVRVVIARPGETAEEGMEVKPTRVLLVPVE